MFPLSWKEILQLNTSHEHLRYFHFPSKPSTVSKGCAHMSAQILLTNRLARKWSLLLMIQHSGLAKLSWGERLPILQRVRIRLPHNPESAPEPKPQWATGAIIQWHRWKHAGCCLLGAGCWVLPASYWVPGAGAGGRGQPLLSRRQESASWGPWKVKAHCRILMVPSKLPDITEENCFNSYSAWCLRTKHSPSQLLSG